MQERHLAGLAAQGRPQRNLPTGFMLLYGGLAGVAAETTVYPLQIVQRYMQLHSHTGERAAWLAPDVLTMRFQSRLHACLVCLCHCFITRHCTSGAATTSTQDLLAQPQAGPRWLNKPTCACMHFAPGGVATALSPRHALRLAEMPGAAKPLARAVFRFSDAAAAVYRTSGPKGFYAGILPNIMQARFCGVPKRLCASAGCNSCCQCRSD